METESAPQLLAALYEEYRALYRILEFRMSAMDRRMPITAAAFAGAVASLQSVPHDSKPILFAGLPIALFWFMRAAVSHARSKEDVLRRLQEIELSVNRIVGQDALRFQSQHPNRHRSVGGRTGSETVRAVLTTVLLLLAAAAFQATCGFSTSSDLRTAYVGLLAVAAIAAISEAVKLSRYQYLPTFNLEV